MPDRIIGKLIAAGLLAQASGGLLLGVGVIVVLMICMFLALIMRVVFGL